MIKRILSGALLLSLLAGGGFYYYQNYWPKEAPRQAVQELTIFTWEEYFDEKLAKEFEQEANARIKWVYYGDDADRDAKLKEESTLGIDLVLLGERALFLNLKRGWLDRLDAGKIPALGHIDPQWYERFPLAEGYAVPYFWGTTGILYRRDMVSEPIKSWKQLFDPPKEVRGLIQMPADPRELMASALWTLGYSSNTERGVLLNEAGDLLRKQEPYVKRYAHLELDEKSTMLTGDAAIATAYSGDAVTLIGMNENLEYVVPREGGGLWMDFFAVMSNSDHKELAYKFLDFINQPKNAARNAESLSYATPNRAALPLLSAEFRENRNVFPDPETIARCEYQKPLPGWVVRQMENILSRIIPEEKAPAVGDTAEASPKE